MPSNFHLYVRSSLQALFETYSACRREDLQCHAGRNFRSGNDVFSQEWIAIPTRGMGVWLEQCLVKDGHVVAGVDFMTYPSAIERVFEALWPNADGADMWSENALVWRIDGILSDPARCPKAIQKYLMKEKAAPAVRRYELSTKLAKMYFDYMLFLPGKLHPEFRQVPGGKSCRLSETLFRTENIPEEYEWQFSLWQELCRETEQHPLSWKMMAFLTSPMDAQKLEPLPPLTFFGISAMPPFFLLVLSRLAEVKQVNFFYHNPCREEWSMVRNQWERRNDFYPEDGSLNDVDNTLLGNLGTHGRQFFRAILDLQDDIELAVDEEDDTDGEEDQPPTLLKTIQMLIHQCRQNEDFVLNPADDSVSFHSCFNKVREVEVLQDCLQLLFKRQEKAGKPLHFDDVIVMAPAISEFETAIRDVFGRGVFKDHFLISDRSLKSINHLASVFLEILMLGKTNFEVTRMIRLLSTPCLMRRYALTDELVERLSQWVVSVNIRNDRDEQGGVFSWRHGLDRLLIALAIEGEDVGFAGLMPATFNPSAENMAGLGSLCQFFRTVCQIAEDVQQGDRTAAEWCERLDEWRDELFQKGKEDAMEYGQLGDVLRELRQAVVMAGRQDEKMPFEVIAAELDHAMALPPAAQQFLNGKITFCSMMPMRGIPRRVVVMLGMDFGVFPRPEEQAGFNLMHLNQLPYYDRSRVFADQYAFLEALLAAQETLIVLYQGLDDHEHIENDNQKDDLEPAQPVLELGEFIDRLCQKYAGTAVWRKRLRVPHRLNSFDPVEFSSTERTATLRQHFSFQKESARVAEMATTATEMRGTDSPEAFFKSAIEGGGTNGVPRGRVSLDLKQLESFLKNATGCFVGHALGVPPSPHEEDLPNGFDPIGLSALQRNQVKVAVSLAANGNSREEQERTKARLFGTGMLPEGQLGENAWSQAVEDVLISDEWRSRWIAQQQSAPEALSVDLGTVTIGLDALDVNLDFSARKSPRPKNVNPVVNVKECLLAAYGEAALKDSTAANVQVTLTGVFRHQPGGGVIECPFASLKGHHYIGWMLKSYMLEAAGIFGTSAILQKNKGEQWYGVDMQVEGNQMEHAKDWLRRVVQLYYLGQRMPLPLFRDLSFERTQKVLNAKRTTDILPMTSLASERTDMNIQMMYGRLPDMSEEMKLAAFCLGVFCYGDLFD